MGMTGISQSQVSRLCQEIDARVKVFLEIPLTGRWPYLWLDATYIKSREHGPVASQAVVVATAVNAKGHREVLGLSVGPAESEAFWCEFLRSLKQQQLAGVRLVISDAHEGLKKAIATVFAGAVFLEQKDEWTVSRRYMSLESLAPVLAERREDEKLIHDEAV